jgi:hypothetical protein
MKTNTAEPRHFEFGFPCLDTLVRVEVADGDVTVRATRDTFSRQRKTSFVRMLAAEGFIPEEFSWVSLEDVQLHGRAVRWLVDFSWLEIGEAGGARSRRFGRGLLAFGTLAMALLVGLVATGRLAGASPEPVAIHPHWVR